MKQRKKLISNINLDEERNKLILSNKYINIQNNNIGYQSPREKETFDYEGGGPFMIQMLNQNQKFQEKRNSGVAASLKKKYQDQQKEDKKLEQKFNQQLFSPTQQVVNLSKNLVLHSQGLPKAHHLQLSQRVNKNKNNQQVFYLDSQRYGTKDSSYMCIKNPIILDQLDFQQKQSKGKLSKSFANSPMDQQKQNISFQFQNNQNNNFCFEKDFLEQDKFMHQFKNQHLNPSFMNSSEIHKIPKTTRVIIQDNKALLQRQKTPLTTRKISMSQELKTRRSFSQANQKKNQMPSNTNILIDSQDEPTYQQKFNEIDIKNFDSKQIDKEYIQMKSMFKDFMVPKITFLNQLMQPTNYLDGLKYFIKCKKGKQNLIGENKDCFIALENIGKQKDSYFFSICDGHGQYGSLIVELFKIFIPKMVEHHQDILLAHPKKGLDQIYTTMNEILVSESQINLSTSGCAAISVFLYKNKVFCANVGDSRAISARKNPTQKKFNPLQISKDHRLTNEIEAERIQMNGGKISPYINPLGKKIGPNRIWLPDQNIPGLAMTRSFGDSIAHSIGVTYKPDLFGIDLNQNDKIIVIASNGLWEFLGNKDVISIVENFYDQLDCEGACNKLIEEATKRWKKLSNIINDITLIVIFLK